MPPSVPRAVPALRVAGAALVALLLASCASTRDYVPAIKLLVISGTVTTAPPVTLPKDAVVKVQLADVTRADAPPKPMANLAFVAEGKALPLPYSLRYEGADLDSSRVYALFARVEQLGRVLLVVETPTLVNPFAQPANVELRLVVPPAPK